jgi:CobQ/CobB/MinD/ParA family nucleotide binding protein
MKSTVILVGADKGGVGKTTLSRALLDYFGRKGISVRAFDTEYPRGTLKRFHPAITEIIDFSNVADQMKVLDTLDTAGVRVTLVDLKAGNLSIALDTFDRIGALDAARTGQFDLGLFHVIGSAIASLEEINEVAKYLNGVDYVISRNFINETNFFEWDQKTYKKYFAKLNAAHEIDIPRLNAMAYEQVDLAAVPFKDFIDSKNAQGEATNFSFVLRGYVRKWCHDLDAELEKLKLIQGLTAAQATASAKRAG